MAAARWPTEQIFELVLHHRKVTNGPAVWACCVNKQNMKCMQVIKNTLESAVASQLHISPLPWGGEARSPAPDAQNKPVFVFVGRR